MLTGTPPLALAWQAVPEELQDEENLWHLYLQERYTNLCHPDLLESLHNTIWFALGSTTILLQMFFLLFKEMTLFSQCQVLKVGLRLSGQPPSCEQWQAPSCLSPAPGLGVGQPRSRD